ncbi:MAG: pilus assembly protein, partial [Geminicoccaceae bacterium]|nr:pilus assembly protein [Geminicoccaceae bacterium]
MPNSFVRAVPQALRRHLDRARSRRRRPCPPGEAGASAVEFALILPVFLLLVMGALQFGWILFVRHELYAAAQQICRQLALGADTAATATTALQREMARLRTSGTLRV